MFRRNLNLKNIRQFKILLRNINHECRISRPNTISLTSVSRTSQSHRCFAVAALSNYNEVKENGEVENLNTVTLQDVDKLFMDMDFNIKRTGRCYKTNVENILSMIDKLGTATDIHGLYLLRCCGLLHMEKPEDRVQLANIIWQKLHELNVPLDVKHFNSLLKVFVDCNHQFLPSDFLASMEGSEIEPNKATYLLLMEKYCNDGNLSGAGEILQCLKDKGLPINETMFTLLIKGHMRANDASGAQDILEVMRSANLSPTAESYAALACGYAEKGNIDGLNSILAEAKDNVTFSNKHYLDIISSWSDSQNLKIIDEMLEKIVDIQDWKQETANIMIGLVHKGIERDSIAFKLLLRIANPENSFVNIFLKTLVKCDRPKDYIVGYCEEISDRELHNYAFMNTAKMAIDVGKFDLTLALFEALQKKGIPVRTNNLNLLLSSFKDEEGIWMTLKKMFQLGVPAEHFTYLDYVFPAVSVSNPEAVLSKIQETGHSFTAAIDPLFLFYCYRGDFDNALYLIEKYPVSVHPSFSLEKYFNILRRSTNNSKARLKVLHFLLQNMGVMGAQDPEVSLGINLATLIQKDPSLLDALLRTLNEPIQLSRKSFDICSTILRRNKPESLVYLKRLGNFRIQSSAKKTPTRSITDEEEELKSLKEKGLPTQRFLLDCLSDHLRKGNVTRINQLMEELDKQGTSYPPTVLTLLLNFYCQNNDLEKAEHVFKVLKSDCPTFKLDSLRVIQYATFLIRCSKLEDAVNIIKMECQELHLFGYPEAVFTRAVRNLLTVAVETGNSDLVKSLHDALSPHAETLQANVLYEPLVKMHLYKNDLDNAINEFEKCVKNHRVIPCLKLLMKKCIVSENSSSLEIVMKSASSLVGRQAVLYDLVVAFLETGRRSEAMKTMENLKNNSYTNFLEDICTQMYYKNRIVDLFELVKLLWTVDHIDREKIACHVLKLSSKQKDLKTAQDLYNSVLKSFELSNEIKELFSNIKSPVPFTASGSDTSAFLQCLQEGDAHLALKNLQSLKKGVVRTLEFSCMTDLVDLLLKNKILNDFSQNINAMSYVIENSNEILKPLLEKYSSSGDIDLLLEIANNFPDFTLRKCSFNNFLTKAYITNEKYEDLLLELEKRWDRKSKLFSIFAFEQLLKRPDLEERAINLAKKYLETNFDIPIAMVWAHYLIHGRYEEAEAFYKSYSVPAEKVDTLVLRKVRQQENIPLGMAYISAINKADAQKRCKERTYGTVLDILVLKEMYDDAAALVVEAQTKDIDLEKFYQSTLITLKNALEREKKKVPFSIPAEGPVISE